MGSGLPRVAQGTGRPGVGTLLPRCSCWWPVGSSPDFDRFQEQHMAKIVHLMFYIFLLSPFLMAEAIMQTALCWK